MATNLFPVQPIGIRASATLSHRKQEGQGRKSSGSGWWTPLFGWSSEPDYIDSDNNNNNTDKKSLRSESEVDPRPVRSRVAPGSFTEEKARKLRMMTTETAAFHEMYHSAIASRLASDFSDRSRGL